MKKQIILFAALAIAISFSAIANNGDHMIVKIEKSEAAKSFKLQLANLENQRTNISLVDVNGISWFFESVNRQNGYAKQLNLRGLPSGDYVLLINRKRSQHVQALSLGADDVAFFQAPGSAKRQDGVAILTSNPPVVKGKLVTKFSAAEGQQVGIQLANLMEQPAKIQVVAPHGGIMLTKTVTDENGYGATWDFADMNTGNYFFYIHASDATVIQFFQLTEDGVELTGQQRMEQVKTGQPGFSVR